MQRRKPDYKHICIGKPTKIANGTLFAYNETDICYICDVFMRKATAIFVLFFYLIPALGFTITTHFCAGELTDISLYSTERKCACGGDMSNSNCCKSVVTHAEFDDSQDKTSTVSIDLLKITKELGIANNLSFSINTLLEQPIIIQAAHPPDDIAVQPLYLKNKVFRI